MTMEDLLEVTDEMMDYLRGDREDLHVMTVMDGQSGVFQCQRNRPYGGCSGLFLAAISIRRVASGSVCLCPCLYGSYKADMKRLLPPSVCLGTGLFFGPIAALAAIISTDFTKYFIMFHHIFFSNDLWIPIRPPIC